MTQRNSMRKLNSPVLFLIFNRPDTTKRVFEEIRRAKPERLYVAADGPRENVREDAELCEAAREVVKDIDWDCHVQTLYREKNYGCKVAPSSAITWFFEHEPEGIVLEDDCVPHPAFFGFCSELLDHFRHDERIMMISGSNHLNRWKDDRQSYHFSTGGAWGWASWRRAWAHYDIDMKRWIDPEARRALRSMLVDRRLLRSDERVFRKTYEGEIDTWDYQWRFARLINSGLTVTPSRNLISNIGFRSDGTHTRRQGSALANLPVYDMDFPLKHNPVVALDQEYVKRAFDVIQPRLARRIWNRLNRQFKAFRQAVSHPFLPTDDFRSSDDQIQA